MDTSLFLQTHQVFTLEEAHRALHPPGGKKATLERLKYHQGKGRLKLVTRGVYATTPPDMDLGKFRADAFLVAAALRSDALFSHHSALELLGATRSEQSPVTICTRSRRSPVDLDGQFIRFLNHPPGLRRARREDLGTQEITRSKRTLRITGPERTLIDGLRQPHLAGGVDKLVELSAEFSVLDLNLLQELLKFYNTKMLWAAVGWFLERYRHTFDVNNDALVRFEKHRPRAPQYLLRSERGGTFAPRWNMIMPNSLTRWSG